MKGDYSRFSFDPKKHYRAVLMQQGRLQLDADWNEQVQMMEHRYNAFFQSMVGRSGTPKNNEMEPSITGESTLSFTLSDGVFYIDGLLIENEYEKENKKKISLPVSINAGNFLFYLDAWTREVSAVEDGNLIDPAIGLETTTRLKTEWAVRCQAMGLGKPDDIKEPFKWGNWPSKDIKGDWWRNLSTGTLTLDDTGNSNNEDNRLYRIEVHHHITPISMGFSEYKFKLSADNACTCAEAIFDNNALFTLQNYTEDMQNAFMGVTHIELFNPGESGQSEGFWLMVDINDNNHFDLSKGILSLGTNEANNWKKIISTAGEWNSSRKIIIRRWDDVVTISKEGGTFGLPGLGAKFSYTNTDAETFNRHGDYWLVQIRKGKIVNWDVKTKAPDGVEHHFAALGIADNDGKFIPLSVVFNPLTSPDLFSASSAIMTGNLDIGGNLTVGGTTKLNGDTIIGTASVNKTLTVNGAATIGSSKTGAFTESLIVNGQATISGRTITGTPGTNAGTSSLEVHGGTTINGNLNITGNATAPTAAVGTNSTTLATTAFVQSQLAASAAPLVSPNFTGGASISGDTNLFGKILFQNKLPITFVQCSLSANDPGFQGYGNTKNYSMKLSQIDKTKFAGSADNYYKYVPIVVGFSGSHVVGGQSAGNISIESCHIMTYFAIKVVGSSLQITDREWGFYFTFSTPVDAAEINLLIIDRSMVNLIPSGNTE